MIWISLQETRILLKDIHLDGEKLLKYTRMRYEDPRGDFGRQMRQRQVIQAVIKGASVKLR